MPRLDDPSTYRDCDPSRMLQTALDLPRQIRDAWQIGRTAALGRLPGPPAHVVAVGMGGSAIGGDLLAAALGERLALPLVVVRDSRLPAYVGQRSLVVATSYSGETEETLAAAAEACRAGAALLAITSGGRLAALATGTGGAVVRVPGGLAPRAALERWELCGPCGPDVEEAAAVLEEVASEAGPDIPAPDNPAKRLAEQLLGRIPAIYAGSQDLEAAARRWKCQLNENSKMLATWAAFPELAHNETVGWGAPPEVSGLVSVIVLLGGGEHPEALRRVRLACELAFRPAAGVQEVRGRGKGRLARILSLVLVGDLVSIYLACLRGIDPTPTEAITVLKRRMRGEA